VVKKKKIKKNETEFLVTYHKKSKPNIQYMELVKAIDFPSAIVKFEEKWPDCVIRQVAEPKG
jgi:hypothetical protein